MDQRITSTKVLHPWGSVNGAPDVGRMLIFGGGYTGLRFGGVLHAMGVPVTLTHRPPLPPSSLDPHCWLHFDASVGALPGAQELEGVTHVLVTIPPDGTGNDSVLSHLRTLSLAPKWVGVLST
ncbi:MAG: NAD-binding protein, partial [Cyanobacteriota bacterium]|nr:NAD-binding protein [Cyanobacteriota bacterium]